MNPYALSIVYGLLFATGLVVLVCVAMKLRPHPPRCVFTAGRGVLRHQPRTRRGVRFLGAACLGVVVGGVTGWPVAGIAVAAGVFAVPRLLHPVQPAQDIAVCEALAAWSRRLGDVLAAGAGGLPQAITRTAATAPAPLTEHAQRLARRVRTAGTEQALQAFADEVADPAADELVLALLLRHRAGGRGLAEILHAQAATRAADATARREVEADRAGPRTTVRSLLGITVLLVAGLVTVAGNYLTPYDTPTGQVVLLLIAAVMGAALWWMQRLTATRLRPRYLAHQAGETS